MKTLRIMKKRKLLLVGFSNWNYYLDEAQSGVIAVSKKENETSESYFGDVENFKLWLLDKLEKNDLYETRLTANGFGIIPEYQIK